MDPTPSDEALIAHVLRRTGFVAHASEVAAWSDRGVEELIEHQLSAAPVPTPQWPRPRSDDWDVYDDAVGWILDRTRAADAGLHDRMAWFWHDHFPSNHDKVRSAGAMAEQHVVLRRHALGDFRELVRDIVKGPAMLKYLDGVESYGDNPNENLARELMELFTLGHGHYSEADVRAGARALSGWFLDDAWNPYHDPGAGYRGEVTFLGHTGQLDIDDVVDIVCAHEQCPPHITAKVASHLLGTTPPADVLDGWARRFRSSGLDIGVLVGDVLRDPLFLRHRLNRVRGPLEWLSAAMVATEHTGDHVVPWSYRGLGQAPWAPPNVGGWPQHSQWAGADQVLGRLDLAVWLSDGDHDLDAADPVGDVLDRCALHEVSAATRSTLEEIASDGALGSSERHKLVLGLALSSPEFQLT